MRDVLARVLGVAILGLAITSLASCGGSGSDLTATGSSASSSSSQVIAAPGANAAAVVVDCGPAAICNTDYSAVNTLYVTVTVCQPGTSTCATIDHVQVDTGSYGLRLLSQALPSGFSLPAEYSSTNNEALAECTEFADGYSWGPLVLADVEVASETASSVPMQVIGDPNYTSVPSDCSGTGGSQEDTVMTFGANGILGVGPFAQDCGATCAQEVVGSGYYQCLNATTCASAQVTLAQQVTNPVVLFSSGDANGVIVELPSIPAGGAASVTGTLVFGISTENNNEITTQTILPADPGSGDITTTYNGTALTGSYIDSGSNGYFFADSSIPGCTVNTYFFCPSSTLDLSATVTGSDNNPSTTGATYTVDFSIANADSLNGSYTAFDDLGGSLTSQQSAQGGGVFDWGLPFFFGRNVFTAIDGEATPVGEGPYFAY